jgi:5'-3' exonuclease
MGVRYLNSFLTQNCTRGIYPVTFNHLRHKTVVVDASIFMYRFKRSGALIPRLEKMLRQMRFYKINPVFIFDGKPPAIKRAEIERRAQRSTMRVSGADLAEVKALLQLNRVPFFVAPGEAEVVCAKMVCNNEAYACFSDDTDLFVHGCDRVIRNVDFERETMTLYDLDTMLRHLGMSLLDFKQLCVASGTDYYKPKNRSLYGYASLYATYRQIGAQQNFLEWLEANKHLEDADKVSEAYLQFA